jgi:hypothetical protein
VASSGGARGLADYGAAAIARVDGWLDLSISTVHKQNFHEIIPNFYH